MIIVHHRKAEQDGPDLHLTDFPDRCIVCPGHRLTCSHDFTELAPGDAYVARAHEADGIRLLLWKVELNQLDVVYKLRDPRSRRFHIGELLVNGRLLDRVVLGSFGIFPVVMQRA